MIMEEVTSSRRIFSSDIDDTLIFMENVEKQAKDLCTENGINYTTNGRGHKEKRASFAYALHCRLRQIPSKQAAREYVEMLEKSPSETKEMEPDKTMIINIPLEVPKTLGNDWEDTRKTYGVIALPPKHSAPFIFDSINDVLNDLNYAQTKSDFQDVLMEFGGGGRIISAPYLPHR